VKASSGSEWVGPVKEGQLKFELTCTGADGIAADKLSTASIDVAANPLALTLTAAQPSVNFGGETTLSWQSNADTCSASGAWAGAVETQGSASTGPLSAESNLFTLTCSGAGGLKITRSVMVKVVDTDPTVTLSASAYRVNPGDTVSLNWSSSKATSCSASGAWEGSRPTRGVAVSRPLVAASNVFKIDCRGPNAGSRVTR